MSLLPFQIECVNQKLEFLRKNGCVYNACEMGLGKTIQTIAVLKQLGRIEHVLILAPKSAVGVWRKELDLWWPERELKTLHITTYGVATRNKKELAAQLWDVLILDEAHYVKNASAQRSRAVFGSLWDRSAYKICLSGTPFTRAIADAHSVFSRMYPAFGEYWDFAARYSNVRMTPWGRQSSGVKNFEELARIARENFLVRRTKAEVGIELPDKIYSAVNLGREYRVKLTKEQEEAYAEYVELLKQCYVRQDFSRVPKMPVSAARIRREQGLAKVVPAAEFCEDFLTQKVPIVVLAYHTDVIEGLKLRLARFKPAVIDGSTSESDRALLVDAFQTGDDDTDCMIMQISTAIGVTLTRASHCIVVEPDYSPGVMSQAINRLHRIGQKNAVNVYYLMVEDSKDQAVMDIVIDKLKSFEKVLG